MDRDDNQRLTNDQKWAGPPVHEEGELDGERGTEGPGSQPCRGMDPTRVLAGYDCIID